jgi:hypothetical protein
MTHCVSYSVGGVKRCFEIDAIEASVHREKAVKSVRCPPGGLDRTFDCRGHASSAIGPISMTPTTFRFRLEVLSIQVRRFATMTGVDYATAMSAVALGSESIVNTQILLCAQ